MSGKEVYFPAPEGGMGLLEAMLLRNRKGEVLSLLPLCKKRIIKVDRQVYHVYRL
ncbi:MAG: hypothetical protein QW251_04105 [Desulfurococcaceae archaeon]